MQKTASLLLLIAGLAGCATAPLPEDHYYRLENPAPVAAPTAPALVASINVQRVHMTGIYGERPLLYSTTQAPTELHQYHYHYWADSPARLIQEQLTDYLRAASLAREVSDDSSNATAEYQLIGTVQRFEQLRDGAVAQAHVELELTVLRTADGQRLFSKRYRVNLATRDSTPLAAAQGLGQALAQCFAAFGDDLRDNGLH